MSILVTNADRCIITMAYNSFQHSKKICHFLIHLNGPDADPYDDLPYVARTSVPTQVQDPSCVIASLSSASIQQIPKRVRIQSMQKPSVERLCWIT